VPSPRSPHRGLITAIGVLVVVISALDGLTPAGIVVGILLGVPIVLASMLDRPRDVVWTGTLALVGFLVAAAFGQGPISPRAVWVPNRILAGLLIPAFTAMALVLQRSRRAAERARDAALSVRDMNGLLLSLMAHDLRTPLTIASEALLYVQGAIAAGQPIDDTLLEDTRRRLLRNLRAIEAVLMVARADMSRGDSLDAGSLRVPLRVREVIASEVESFGDEAVLRGKTLRTRLASLEGRELLVNAIVLRQAITILLDNALRHAVPGPIEVEAWCARSHLLVRISDAGPGLRARRASRSESDVGSRLGLDLCRALVARVGGGLDVEQDSADGTTFLLRLPASPIADPTVPIRRATPPASPADVESAPA
jgi:signal transduction histidine kinase